MVPKDIFWSKIDSFLERRKHFCSPFSQWLGSEWGAVQYSYSATLFFANFQCSQSSTSMQHVSRLISGSVLQLSTITTDVIRPRSLTCSVTYLDVKWILDKPTELNKTLCKRRDFKCKDCMGRTIPLYVSNLHMEAFRAPQLGNLTRSTRNRTIHTSMLHRSTYRIIRTAVVIESVFRLCFLPFLPIMIASLILATVRKGFPVSLLKSLQLPNFSSFSGFVLCDSTTWVSCHTTIFLSQRELRDSVSSLLCPVWFQE